MAAAARKHLRVLLPFSRDSLRIPDELAEDIGAAEAHVVVPSGNGKVRRVEVGRDGDGAFLGRGWPEFAAACGVGAGWVLVLRHHGGGVLTVKAFDETCCLREVPARTPAVAVEATTSSSDTPRRPKFVSVLSPDSMEKMQIPAKFVQSCIPKEHLNNMAVVLAPLAKISQIEVEMNLSGVFFAGGWSEFLTFHGITDANYMLLRYEGNMVFTLKVFEPNGFQRESKQRDIRSEQNMALPTAGGRYEMPSGSIQKCKSRSSLLGSEGQKEGKISKTTGGTNDLGKTSFPRNSAHGIETPSLSIKKQMNTTSLKKKLYLPKAFCDALGLRESRMITLKTSMDNIASWQVHGLPCKNNSYMLLGGWRKFCKENKLSEGDICTFNVVETTLWTIDVTRYTEMQQEIPFASSMICKSKNDGKWCEKQMRSAGSRASLNKVSRKACDFDIGPPAWLKKEINASTIERQFSLPLSFCNAIGIRERCMITLKTSTSSTMAWQVCAVPYPYCFHVRQLGWKAFCRENGIKIGDICTFNIIEPLLWHVVITRR